MTTQPKSAMRSTVVWGGSVSQTFLRCSKCGTEQAIWRRTGRRRKRGHIKHLWCIKCKEHTPHTELGGK